MQIIYSNPWGFGIHSPFVYRLVTQGLSGKKSRLSDKIGLDWHLKFRQKRKLARLLSLIEFFRTNRIKVTDEHSFPGLQIMEILKKKSFFDYTRKDKFPGISSRITLGIDLFQPLPEISGEDIWILTGLENRKTREQFRKMRLNPLVSISIETNYLGILIFNPSYQNQHYQIQSWFYLWSHVFLKK
jgi:hypothetical protein